MLTDGVDKPPMQFFSGNTTAATSTIIAAPPSAAFKIVVYRVAGSVPGGGGPVVLADTVPIRLWQIDPPLGVPFFDGDGDEPLFECGPGESLDQAHTSPVGGLLILYLNLSYRIEVAGL